MTPPFHLGIKYLHGNQGHHVFWLAARQEELVDEVADIDTVPNVKKQHAVTAAISNSFGFGGHNSVCVFGPAPA